jgi:ADP-ribose pyrophosphatase YjhB (NUDIX family)
MNSVPLYHQDTYCTYCGNPFAANQSWPRRCSHCNNITFRNPIPVTIVLQPVGTGVLTIRRGLPPRAGLLALPGGYIELGESWQDAGARELHEEAALEIDPSTINLLRVFSAPDGTLIICGRTPPVAATALLPFTPSAEASERVILEAPAELAFALHTEIVATYFAERHEARAREDAPNAFNR